MVKMESSDDDTETLELQAETVKECRRRQLVAGETWYVVSREWFEKLEQYLGLDDSGDKPPSHPGPIDNSSLLGKNDDGEEVLREHLIDETDYYLIPEDVWSRLVQWYGLHEGQEPIARKVVEGGRFSSHLLVEVYLLQLELCKDFDFKHTSKHSFSSRAEISSIHETARKIFKLPQDVESQIWICIADDSYSLIKEENKAIQEEVIICPNSKVILDTQREDGTWASDEHEIKREGSSEQLSPLSRKADSTDKFGPIPLPASSSHYLNNTPMSTRYGIAHSNVTPGLCGLTNLGNTCFMNSVLQCMSNTPPITDYFMNDLHCKDLNVENPLGMRGEIAKSFGELIKNMWSGTSNAIPHQFKLQVSKFAPQFSGYQQHDAQELLTFLLDGLHEDLNRIHEKPYIKQRDSDGRPDDVVAAEAWSNYLKRNDSIIVELFHGQLKSTVWCPRCKITSVTFDPLCYLSLPLPPKLDRHVDVIFYPYSGPQKPTQYKVQVPQRAKMSDVLKALHKFTECPVDQMVATEVLTHHFQRIFDPDDIVESSIDDRETLHVYEIPCSVSDKNWVVLPVCQWELNSPKEYSANQLFGTPVLIVVPRKDCTQAILLKAILERVTPYLTITVTPSMLYNNHDGDGVQQNGDVKIEEDSEEENGRSFNNSGHESMDVTVDYPETSTTDSDMEDEDKEDEDQHMHVNGDTLNKTASSFRIFIVNNQKVRDFLSGSKKLTFPEFLGRQYLVVQWQSAARQQYFKESAVNDILKHESCHIYPRTSDVDLMDCLSLYTTKEKLDTSEAWYCPRCKDHIEATKKFDLWNLPRILVIHLKRFQYNRYRRDKIDVAVKFPLHGLDLRHYITDPNYKKSTVYDLIGVCNHYGNLAGGHYTAYGLNKLEKAWYLFDDNSVRKATESQVVSNSAYVLFYMRRDPDDGNGMQ